MRPMSLACVVPISAPAENQPTKTAGRFYMDDIIQEPFRSKMERSSFLAYLDWIWMSTRKRFLGIVRKERSLRSTLVSH
jgi:hypothetical protein